MKSSLTAVGSILLLAYGSIAWGQISESPSMQTSIAEQRIRAALRDETRLEFIETPLDDVLCYLRDMHDIPIWLDTRALDAQGIETDAPITADIKGVCLQSALSLILGEWDLEWTIRDESLVITSTAAARQDPACRVYFVGDLIDEGSDAKPLAEVLGAATEVPGKNDGCSSSPRVFAHQQLLIVRGTEKQQGRMAQLLAQIRLIAKGPTAAPSPTPHQTERQKPKAEQEPAEPATDRKPVVKLNPFDGSVSGDDPFGGGGSGDPFAKPPKSKIAPPAGDDPFGS